MTPTPQEGLVELAEVVEDCADRLLRNADLLWFWPFRRASIAFGDLSRDLREVAAALRARSTQTRDV